MIDSRLLCGAHIAEHHKAAQAAADSARELERAARREAARRWLASVAEAIAGDDPTTRLVRCVAASTPPNSYSSSSRRWDQHWPSVAVRLLLPERDWSLEIPWTLDEIRRWFIASDPPAPSAMIPIERKTVFGYKTSRHRAWVFSEGALAGSGGHEVTWHHHSVMLSADGRRVWSEGRQAPPETNFNGFAFAAMVELLGLPELPPAPGPWWLLEGLSGRS